MSLGKSKAAPRKRRAGARRWGKRRVGPRRMGARTALPKRTTGNFASRTETFSIGVTAGLVYDFTHTMIDVPVCEQLAKLYQYYRVTSIQMKFKPNYDTFQAQGTNLVPYLYFQYDKSGSLTGLNAAGFEAIGVKPIRLDDKTITRTWKPSVLTEGGDPAGTGLTQFKVSPWLPCTLIGGATNAAVKHLGAIFYISKMSPGDVLGYDVDVIVNYQFRKPNIAPQLGVSNPEPIRITQGNVSGIDMSLNPSFAN